MTRIIAVTNEKGGAGKTALAVNVAAAWGDSGLRVLVVDLDPQADATTGFDVVVDAAGEATVAELFRDPALELEAAVAAGVAPGVDLLRGSHLLKQVEQSLTGKMYRERFVASFLEGQVGRYDVVLIDCPPAIGNLTVNAIVAADGLVVPVAMKDANSVKGLRELRDDTLLKLARNGAARPILAVVRTRVDGADRDTYRALDDVLQSMEVPLTSTVWGERSGFHDSAVEGRPLLLRALKPHDRPVAHSVRALAAELADLLGLNAATTRDKLPAAA